MGDVTTYLGPKGYTIYKDYLSIEEQQFIRTELNVKAFVPKSISKIEPFPVYRESQKKFYIPRFFGESIYGEADEIRIPEPKKLIYHSKEHYAIIKKMLLTFIRNIWEMVVDYWKFHVGGGKLLWA